MRLLKLLKDRKDFTKFDTETQRDNRLMKEIKNSLVPVSDARRMLSLLHPPHTLLPMPVTLAPSYADREKQSISAKTTNLTLLKKRPESRRQVVTFRWEE